MDRPQVNNILIIDGKRYVVTRSLPHEPIPGLYYASNRVGWGEVQRVTKAGKPTGRALQVEFYAGGEIKMPISRRRVLSTTYSRENARKKHPRHRHNPKDGRRRQVDGSYLLPGAYYIKKERVGRKGPTGRSSNVVWWALYATPGTSGTGQYQLLGHHSSLSAAQRAAGASSTPWQGTPRGNPRAFTQGDRVQSKYGRNFGRVGDTGFGLYSDVVEVIWSDTQGEGPPVNAHYTNGKWRSIVSSRGLINLSSGKSR